MRTAYCEKLHEIMAEDDRVFALTADIGFRNFDHIIEDFPERFINVGIAEANMIGVAAGLALAGKIPFVFTLAPFVTLRCLEQIRIDLCYQKLPVKLIGAGGGFVYGPQGTTHHAIEEIGVLRTLPNMTIVAPSDALEVKKATKASMSLHTPIYIRIGRNNEPVITGVNDSFQIGRSKVMREGEHIAVLTYGSTLQNVMEAADFLSQKGIRLKVINMHTIKPLDKNIVIQCAEEIGCMMTVEEHNVLSGLGSAVAEILAEDTHKPVRFKRVGVQDSFLSGSGHYDTLLRQVGLDRESLVRQISSFLADAPFS